VDNNVEKGGGGPPTFRTHDEFCHQFGSLLPHRGTWLGYYGVSADSHPHAAPLHLHLQATSGGLRRKGGALTLAPRIRPTSLSVEPNPQRKRRVKVGYLSTEDKPIPIEKTRTYNYRGLGWVPCSRDTMIYFVVNIFRLFVVHCCNTVCFE